MLLEYINKKNKKVKQFENLISTNEKYFVGRKINISEIENEVNL